MEKESLTLRFEGTNDIDLSTLSNALHSTVNCLRIISDNILAPEDHCKFLVKSVRPGSFVLDISVIKEVSETLIPIVNTIIGTFVCILQIRKHNRGKLPEKFTYLKDNKVDIVNNYGASKTFNSCAFNIYINDNEIDKNLAELSRSISKDSDRKSLIVEEHDSKNNIITVSEYDSPDLIETADTLDVESLSTEFEKSFSTIWVKIKKCVLFLNGNF